MPRVISSWHNAHGLVIPSRSRTCQRLDLVQDQLRRGSVVPQLASQFADRFAFLDGEDDLLPEMVSISAHKPAIGEEHAIQRKTGPLQIRQGAVLLASHRYLGGCHSPESPRPGYPAPVKDCETGWEGCREPGRFRVLTAALDIREQISKAIGRRRDQPQPMLRQILAARFHAPLIVTYSALRSPPPEECDTSNVLNFVGQTIGFRRLPAPPAVQRRASHALADRERRRSAPRKAAKYASLVVTHTTSSHEPSRCQ